jgi:hypothetical protein
MYSASQLNTECACTYTFLLNKDEIIEMSTTEIRKFKQGTQLII